jgi:hypothetical protein
MSSAVVQNCTQIKLATENPARTEFISKVAFCCGLGFLLFLAGMVAAINQSPPYHTVRDAWLALSAFGEQRELLASQWPAYTWMPAATSNKGLVTNQPGQTSGDYTLYTSGHSGDVMLLDMGGNLVHRWEAGFRKVWPSAPHVPSWLPEHFVYVRRAHATPNGDLLALYETTTNTPSGCGLAKLDRTGNVLWTFDANAHHDFCIDTSGRIYVLTHQIRRITDTDTKLIGLKSIPLIEDTLAILSPDGKLIETISVLDALIESPFFLPPSCHVDRHGDITHNNTVNLIGPGFAEQHQGVEAGDLMICLRNLGLVAVLSLSEKKLVWATTGPWNHPHDSDPLENGNILIFDNLLVQGEEVGAGVVEFDPKLRQIIQTYSRDSNGRIRSDIRACQQVLTKGNLLVTESDRGRLLEINSAGETVWEYVNPVRRGEDHSLIPIVCGARRYRRNQLPFLNNTTDLLTDINTPGAHNE